MDSWLSLIWRRCEVSSKAKVQVYAALMTLFHRAVQPGMETDVQQLLK